MSEYPKLKLPDAEQLVVEQTDKDLAEKPDPNFRYAYFRTVAKGGKSLIQSCKDLHLNRTICYKTLLPEFANDEIEQKRLLREARVSAMLQHPNIVPTYELGRNKQGHYYFTMKLVHGYTLREVFDYRERYDLSQLINIIVQVAYALEYAHALGVIHRDVKPENILIGPYGEILLLDWGLAKVWDKDGAQSSEETDTPGRKDENVTMTGYQKLQGTLMYMSPEQIEKDPGIDYRSDIFSLGVILYEALTGKTPVEGELIDEVIESILKDEPIAPSDIDKNVPAILEDATMQCLHKKPEERVQSAGQLIRLLKQNWSLL
ncbi:MAG: serine/threonine protein kinase [Gammaproteobacteria bacterium]|nr:serine/threonine protein kinase [Gammaproteobacteria bacterium]